MNRPLIFRQAVIQDLPRLVPLFDSYREYFGQSKDPAAVERFLFEKFEHRESVIFIAEGEEAMAGFAQLYPSFSSLSLQRVWILNDFFISEPYRHRGTGRRLLQAVKEFATLTGAKGVELSVEHTNERAWRFYEMQGFVMDEEFRHYFWKI
ncbi:GNAT family N-acetyltransferase [Paenibacillus hamazuiensis]|uniref:GNAT family N-acetyltransferase n=1 Tax=Paenibacillus hamazuiensis TaxID=2936508 RepID=UPI00200E7352|nr:GNAT family N-acetyltransferase [Paenibacillus hamazuiensis]